MADEQEELVTEVKGLLFSQDFGVLSTFSEDVEGYPFGSVTPYSLDFSGKPVILISTIAQHTKNIIQNNKVSLTILRRATGRDQQAVGRITYLADAELVADNTDDFLATSSRHYRFFPNSKSYHGTHDFKFYRLQPKRVRYIGGFGKIHWVESEQILQNNPFDNEAEVHIVDHMNKDHGESIANYCVAFKGLESGESAVMAGIDALGFDVNISGLRLRFPFQESISTSEQAREQLVELAKMARRVISVGG